MDMIKSFFWFLVIFAAAAWLKRVYFAIRYRQIAEAARYKWHLLEPRQKALILCAEWMREVENIKQDFDYEKADVEKVYDNANYFLYSELRMETCFEAGILELWKQMKISADFDMTYARASLDKLFINYDEKGHEFNNLLQKFNDPLKAVR